MKAPVSRLRKSTYAHGERSACEDHLDIGQKAELDLYGHIWTYFPRPADVQVLDHLAAWWAHAFLERHGPLHEGVGLLDDIAGRHGSNEKLGFAAFDLHHFPQFGMSEGWGGIGWINGVGLGLVEDDHGCDCCWDAS